MGRSTRWSQQRRERFRSPRLLQLLLGVWHVVASGARTPHSARLEPESSLQLEVTGGCFPVQNTDVAGLLVLPFVLGYCLPNIFTSLVSRHSTWMQPLGSIVRDRDGGTISMLGGATQ